MTIEKEKTPEEELILGEEKRYMIPGIAKGILFYGGILLMFIFTWYVPAIMKAYFGLPGAIGAYLLLPIILIIFIYAIWAPANITWTVVKENQTKGVFSMGLLKKILFVSKDKLLLGNEVVEIHELTYREIAALVREGRIKIYECEDDDSCENRFVKGTKWKGQIGKDDEGNPLLGTLYIEIIKSWMERIFGGLKFIGPYPFFTIGVYLFGKWRGVGANNKIEEHKAEWTDHIDAINVGYVTTVKGVDKNNLPVSAELASFGKMVDPVKFIIDTLNGLDQSLQVSHAEVSRYLRRFAYVEINATIESESKTSAPADNILGSDTEIGSIIWQRLNNNGTLTEIRKMFGMRFSSFKVITPFILTETEDQRQSKEPYYAQQQKTVDITRAEGKKAVTVLGAEGAAESQAITYGKAKEIYTGLELYAKTDDEKRSLFEWCLDVVRRNAYIVTGQGFDIHVNDGKQGSGAGMGGSIEEIMIRAGAAGNLIAQSFLNQSKLKESAGTSNSSTFSDYRRKKTGGVTPEDVEKKKGGAKINNPNSIFHGMDAQKVNSAFGKKKKTPDEDLDEDELEALRKAGLRD